MTKSTAVIINNTGNTDAPVSTESIQSQNSCKQINYSPCNLRTKSEIKLTVSAEQVLKKTTVQTRSNGKNKKASVKKKQDAENERNKDKHSKQLDKCKNAAVSLPNIQKIIKTNRDDSNKGKIVSPNHKLTEYFSDLKVNEQGKDFVNKEVNIKKELIEDNQSPLKKNINNKQSLGNSKTLGKKLKQPITKTGSELTNHKVTEYFQVRRSERKYSKKIYDEKQTDLENKILNKVEDGLQIEEFKDKGRGIITTKEFHKGEFVIEYVGDLISGTIAKKKEIQYSKNKDIGCYMYYFKHKNIQYCIDATEESGKLGRLVNHSRKGNLVSRIVEINQTPHLVLFAKADIPIGTEILYDYGDRSRESVQNHPWLTL